MALSESVHDGRGVRDGGEAPILIGHLLYDVSEDGAEVGDGGK